MGQVTSRWMGSARWVEFRVQGARLLEYREGDVVHASVVQRPGMTRWYLASYDEHKGQWLARDPDGGSWFGPLNYVCGGKTRSFTRLYAAKRAALRDVLVESVMALGPRPVHCPSCSAAGKPAIPKAACEHMEGGAA